MNQPLWEKATAIHPEPERGSVASLAPLWTWLMRKRLPSTGANTADPDRSRLSFWALLLIFTVTKSWSYLIREPFSQSDLVRYYQALQDGSWIHKYYFEQTMFWIVSIFHPTTLSTYTLVSSSIPLCILLYSFYRLGYTRTEQFLLILFFTCSFYGVHFVVTFQRQFYALVIFIFAISGKGRSFVARSASLFSHLYALTLHLFWQLRRFQARILLLIAIPTIPIGFALVHQIAADQFERYSAGGEGSAVALALKEGLNLAYTAVIYGTSRRGDSNVRTLAIAFAIFATPCLVSADYAGVFVRFDYFFFPLLIALWPTCLDARHRKLFRATMLLSTVIGFVLWMMLNFKWIVFGIE